MPGRRNGRRGDLPLSAEINVTSLVDVAFTLLVIFIITAPILQGGVEVDIPEGAVAPLESVNEPVIVTIDRVGTVYLEDQPIAMSDLSSLLRRMVEGRSGATVFVRADSAVSYGPVLEAIAMINEVEGVGLSLVAAPMDARR